MEYNDIKNYTWYKVTTKRGGRTSIRYIYRTDTELNNKDLIFRISSENEYGIMTLSKGYWTRYDRISIVEEFPKDLSIQEAGKHFIYQLFEIGLE